MSLKQFEEDAKWGPQNPTSGTPRPHRMHQLERGETLDRLAAKWFGPDFTLTYDDRQVPSVTASPTTRPASR